MTAAVHPMDPIQALIWAQVSESFENGIPRGFIGINSAQHDGNSFWRRLQISMPAPTGQMYSSSRGSTPVSAATWKSTYTGVSCGATLSAVHSAPSGTASKSLAHATAPLLHSAIVPVSGRPRSLVVAACSVASGSTSIHSASTAAIQSATATRPGRQRSSVVAACCFASGSSSRRSASAAAIHPATAPISGRQHTSVEAACSVASGSTSRRSALDAATHSATAPRSGRQSSSVVAVRCVAKETTGLPNRTPRPSTTTLPKVDGTRPKGEQGHLSVSEARLERTATLPRASSRSANIPVTNISVPNIPVTNIPVTGLIKKCRQWKQLLKFAQDPSYEPNAIHAAAALTHLAQLLSKDATNADGAPRVSGARGSGGDNEGSSIVEPRVSGKSRASSLPLDSSKLDDLSTLLELLLETGQRHVSSMQARELSNVVWSVGKIATYLPWSSVSPRAWQAEKTLLALAGARAQKLLPVMLPIDLANLVGGLAHAPSGAVIMGLTNPDGDAVATPIAASSNRSTASSAEDPSRDHRGGLAQQGGSLNPEGRSFNKGGYLNKGGGLKKGGYLKTRSLASTTSSNTDTAVEQDAVEAVEVTSNGAATTLARVEYTSVALKAYLPVDVLLSNCTRFMTSGALDSRGGPSSPSTRQPPSRLTFGVPELLTLLHGFAVAMVRPSDSWLRCAAQLSLHHMKASKIQGLTMISWSLAKLLNAQPQSNSPPLTGASLGFLAPVRPSDSWLRCAAQLSLHHMQAFKIQGLTMISWSLAKLLNAQPQSNSPPLTGAPLGLLAPVRCPAVPSPHASIEQPGTDHDQLVTSQTIERTTPKQLTPSDRFALGLLAPVRPSDSWLRCAAQLSLHHMQAFNSQGLTMISWSLTKLLSGRPLSVINTAKPMLRGKRQHSQSHVNGGRRGRSPGGGGKLGREESAWGQGGAGAAMQGASAAQRRLAGHGGADLAGDWFRSYFSALDVVLLSDNCSRTLSMSIWATAVLGLNPSHGCKPLGGLLSLAAVNLRLSTERGHKQTKASSPPSALSPPAVQDELSTQYLQYSFTVDGLLQLLHAAALLYPCATMAAVQVRVTPTEDNLLDSNDSNVNYASTASNTNNISSARNASNLQSAPFFDKSGNAPKYQTPIFPPDPIPTFPPDPAPVLDNLSFLSLDLGLNAFDALLPQLPHLHTEELANVLWAAAKLSLPLNNAPETSKLLTRSVVRASGSMQACDVSQTGWALSSLASVGALDLGQAESMMVRLRPRGVFVAKASTSFISAEISE
eukprot:gene1425-32796_t